MIIHGGGSYTKLLLLSQNQVCVYPGMQTQNIKNWNTEIIVSSNFKTHYKKRMVQFIFENKNLSRTSSTCTRTWARAGLVATCSLVETSHVRVFIRNIRRELAHQITTIRVQDNENFIIKKKSQLYKSDNIYPYLYLLLPWSHGWITPTFQPEQSHPLSILYASYQNISNNNY